jgi:membrane associated rhomboid family serine protease
MNEENNQRGENGNQFENNEQNNNNSIYSNEEFAYANKYTKITLSFVIIFLLKLFFYIYFLYNQNTDKFTFDYHFILNYDQYYRCITRFFINYGFVHFLLELYITYILSFYFENMLGTLLTLSIIFVSFILISLVHLLMMKLLIYLFFLMNRRHNLDISYEGGLTPLFFLLYTFYFDFDENNNKIFLFFLIFLVRSRGSEYFILLLLIFFTPNESICGNISGIITAHILMICKKIFLPRINWIKNIESLFKLNTLFPFYRYINDENPIMKKILKEFDKMSEKDEKENGQQMTELTLLSTENEENNENQNNNPN